MVDSSVFKLTLLVLNERFESKASMPIHFMHQNASLLDSTAIEYEDPLLPNQFIGPSRHSFNFQLSSPHPPFGSQDSWIKRGLAFAVTALGLLLLWVLVDYCRRATWMCWWYRSGPKEVAPYDEDEQKEPEKEVTMIHCSMENVRYEYRIAFRVGAPSVDFNLKNGFVEFELLGHGDVVMGIPVRSVLCKALSLTY